MVVTRRKGDNRLGRVSRSTNTNQAAQIKEKGSSDLSQSRALEAESENPKQSNPSDSGNSGTDTTRVVAIQHPQQILEMENDCVMEECKDTSNKKYQQGPRQHFKGKGKVVLKNKSKSSKGLGIKSTKNLKSSKSHLHLSFSSGDKSGQFKNGGSFGRDALHAKNEMGHMSQEQSDCDSRRDNSPNKGGADQTSGVVRGRAGICMETSFSHHPSEHQIGEASSKPQRVESHA